MYLPVTMVIIKGMLTPVDPGALRSGDAISVTHQDETGKCFPPFSFLFSLAPVQCGLWRGSTQRRGLPGFPWAGRTLYGRPLKPVACLEKTV